MIQDRVLIDRRPPRIRNGKILLPYPALAPDHEVALTLELISRRKLFGHCFRNLFPDYFDNATRESGVLIGHFITSSQILPEMTFPGDIDLLVIPYERNELILSSALAIEIKIVRASFAKQGKSPNEFGFSQAQSMFDYGFPYVAVGHLITSDESPKEFWRPVLEARVGKGDTLTNIRAICVDMMSSDLIERSYGRLIKNCKNDSLGLFAAHVNRPGIWFPYGRKCIKNAQTSHRTLRGILDYYMENYNSFIDTPAID